MIKKILKTCLTIIPFILLSINITKANTYITEYYIQGGTVRGQNSGDEMYEGNYDDSQGSGGVYNDDRTISSCFITMSTTFQTDRSEYNMGEDVFTELNSTTISNDCSFNISIFGNGVFAEHPPTRTSLISSPFWIDSFALPSNIVDDRGNPIPSDENYMISTIGTPVFTGYYNTSGSGLYLSDWYMHIQSPLELPGVSKNVLFYGNQPIYKSQNPITTAEVISNSIYINGVNFTQFSGITYPSNGVISYKSIENMGNMSYDPTLTSADSDAFSFVATTSITIFGGNTSPQIFVR